MTTFIEEYDEKSSALVEQQKSLMAPSASQAAAAEQAVKQQERLQQVRSYDRDFTSVTAYIPVGCDVHGTIQYVVCSVLVHIFLLWLCYIISYLRGHISDVL